MPGVQGQATPVAAPQDIVSRIGAILDRDTAPEVPKGAPNEPIVEETTTEPENEVVATPDNAAVEGEDAKPGDAQAMAEIPLEQLEAIELEITIKGDDGKDVVEKPTIKELQKGYMRQKDYSRKTAEVARQREEVGEKVRQAIESERSQYVQNLQTLQNTFIDTVAPELKGVDWNNLAANDPFEYVKLRNRADQITQALSSIQAKQQEAKAKTAADQNAEIAKRAASTRATLEADIPGWNDTLYQSLMKSGESVGFKPEEVGTWLDPRAIKLLHKAYLYDQLKPGKPSVDKKIVVVPKVVKPGASQSTTQAQQREAEAFKRLQNSGSVEDAATIIQERLFGRK